MTDNAVIAFQKVEGLSRTGRATDDVLQALATAAEPAGSMVPGGGATHVEVDLNARSCSCSRTASALPHPPVSTGNNKRYCVDGQCAIAVTPGGSFRMCRVTRAGRRAGSASSTTRCTSTAASPSTARRRYPPIRRRTAACASPCRRRSGSRPRCPDGTPVYVLDGHDGAGAVRRARADDAPPTSRRPRRADHRRRPVDARPDRPRRRRRTAAPDPSRAGESRSAGAGSPALPRLAAVGGVAGLLELRRQLRPAGGDDAPAAQHVHDVGLQLVQQPAVVGDGQHAESPLARWRPRCGGRRRAARRCRGRSRSRRARRSWAAARPAAASRCACARRRTGRRSAAGSRKRGSMPMRPPRPDQLAHRSAGRRRRRGRRRRASARPPRLTPGTSIGYCMARNRPAWARFHVGSAEQVDAVERHPARRSPRSPGGP